jgi:1-acyl-sn-glycerol-3-phosphate acyltransferase
MISVNSWAFKLLNAYLTIRFRLSFHDVLFDLSKIENKLKLDQSVLFIANHSTWWDGFFIYALYKKLGLKKEFKVVMLESELKKFSFLRHWGAVGVIPKDKIHNDQVISGLQGCCVSFFPQGQMYPQSQRPLIFRSGIESVIQKLHPTQIMIVALHIEPFQNLKPTALIKVGEIISSDTFRTYQELASLVETNLNEASINWPQQIYNTRSSPQWKS